MDTEQQQLETLIIVFRGKAPSAQIDPLATPSVLRTTDADGKRALHWALALQEDREVIKLVISLDPTALVSVVGSDGVYPFFRRLPIEKRFSNRDEVSRKLLYCYAAYKQHLFLNSSSCAAHPTLWKHLWRRTQMTTYHCAHSACASRGVR